MPPLQFALDEARQEGLLKGLEIGEEKGIEKGRQEGRQEGRQSIVLKLLQASMDPQKICKITGLSIQEINKLSKK